MKDSSKTKQELIEELSALKKKMKKLEKSEFSHAEEARQESERLIKLALEGTDQGLWEWDLLSGKVVFDENWQRIMNLPLEGRYVDMHQWLASMDVEGRAEFEIKMTDYMEGRERYYELEYRLQTENKEWKWIWTRGIATVTDPSGIPLRMIGTYRDITKDKKQEESLRESGKRTQMIVNNARDVIWMLDMNYQFTFMSSAIEQMSGYAVDEYLSKPHSAFIVPDSLDFLYKTLAEELALENDPKRDQYRSRIVETEQIHKNGSRLWVELKMNFMYDVDGKPNGILGFSRDITSRKQAEEEKRILEERLKQADKMESIGTLAGGIAHDFNNLLAGMQGYVSLTLMNLKENDPNYERLQRIQNQIQSGADLTSQLLGFARGGRYEIKPANMNEILEKSSSMFGRTKKEITIHRKSGKDLWSVEVDRGQLEQVFLNLYVNAWQAMPGGGDIYLETQNTLLNGEQALFYSVKPGKHVKITITDTGTGMDEKTREKIFEPFFTTKGMGRGTGLGLASAYGIIKGHGGMINVYSEPNHGTTFTIYLPASEKEVKTEEIPTEEIVMGTETILIIDDEKVVMEVNKDLLESMGYTVYAAGSGQEGIAVYMEKKDKIDLITLDMIMPGISGSDTFDRLREINPNAKVLLSSGYSLTGKAQAIMDRGCNGFLQKPFKLEELSSKVREMFG